MSIFHDHKQLLDSMTTAVFCVRTTGTFSYLNPAAENIFERSAHRLLETQLHQAFAIDAPRFWQAISNGDTLTLRDTVVSLLCSRQSLECDIHINQLSSGESLLELHPKSSPMLGKDSSTSATQDQMLELVRGMAHEIKNPLGGIRGAAQLLERQLNNEALSEYTGIIIEESDRLRDLIDRMLGPKHRPKFAPMNLHEVAERAARLVRHQYSNIEIIRDYDPSLPLVNGDGNLLIQAALNLVNNAAQAIKSQDSGRITIKTRVARKHVINNKVCRLVALLSITDNGPGIPKELLTRIFLPMFSGRPDGFGLGLPISQSIAQLHRGTIEVSSEVGRTKFTILLPIEEHTL